MKQNSLPSTSSNLIEETTPIFDESVKKPWSKPRHRHICINSTEEKQVVQAGEGITGGGRSYAPS